MQTLVNVFTGYLGSGKTTVILNLVKQLPQDYKVVWLKNEYGNINIDQALAQESHIQTKEIMNGCLCCVLVGRLGNAINEILDTYHPQRIIIESSGTAYPLPIVLELSKIERVQLDSVATVIDVLNFTGYKDIGKVAEMQAQATDLFLLNKHELTTDEQLDNVLEIIGELNPHTPKIKTDKGFVQKDLLFGVDSHIILPNHEEPIHQHDHHEHPDDVEVFEFKSSGKVEVSEIEKVLSSKLEQGYIRIKGIVKTAAGVLLCNWVLGRLDWQPLHEYKGQSQLVFMGQDVTKRFPALEQELVQLFGD